MAGTCAESWEGGPGYPVGERQGDNLKLETRQPGEAGKGWRPPGPAPLLLGQWLNGTRAPL